MKWTTLMLVLASSAILGPSEGPLQKDLLPSDYLTYDELLPADKRNEILAVLRQLPPEKSSQRLHFFSGGRVDGYEVGIRQESYVRLLRLGRWDVWLDRARARQDRANDTGEWEHFAIVVDNAAKPRQAYYLQFVPEAVASGALPRPIRFNASCISCHANGPRFIRPHRADDLIKISATELELMRAWNSVITGYGPINTHVPARPVGLVPLVKSKYEPLLHQACVGCHNNEGGLRSPLRRVHGGTIRSLIYSATDREGYFVALGEHSQAVMPMGTSRLIPKESDCLIDWLKNESGREPAAGCNSRGEVDTQVITDVSTDKVRAKVSSTLGEFFATNFAVLNKVSCRERCGGKLEIDLTRVRTGIALRDQHLKEQYLRTVAYPSASLTIDEFRPGRSVQTVAKLSLTGNSASYPVSLECRKLSDRERCRIKNFSISLKKHRIAEPRIFSFVVSDKIEIEGELDFRNRTESVNALAARKE